jgi:hypothetical protein
LRQRLARPVEPRRGVRDGLEALGEVDGTDGLRRFLRRLLEVLPELLGAVERVLLLRVLRGDQRRDGRLCRRLSVSP